MSIQAVVPEQHLAIAMGQPNVLRTRYSTELLLPIVGPYYVARVIVRSSWRIAEVGRLLTLTDYFTRFVSQVGGLGVDFKARRAPGLYTMQHDRFDREFAEPMRRQWAELAGTLAADARLGGDGAKVTLVTRSRSRRTPLEVRRVADRVLRGELQPSRPLKDEDVARANVIRELARPSRVARAAFEGGLIRATDPIFAQDFMKSDPASRLRSLLGVLIRETGRRAPEQAPGELIRITRRAIDVAAPRMPDDAAALLRRMTPDDLELLARWLAIQLAIENGALVKLQQPDMQATFGYTLLQQDREWAVRRDERLELAFGSPDIRGPVSAEPVPPEGTLTREEYQASENELVSVAAESRREDTTEQISISSTGLQRGLSAIYYAGDGNVADLTDATRNNAVFEEERRATVHSFLERVSAEQERTDVARSLTANAVTVTSQARGVDTRLSATHHRFRVVVPVHATVLIDAFGLTWAPRVRNPFMHLREVIRREYERAYTEYKSQNYVPLPVHPAIDWEHYTASKDVEFEIHSSSKDVDFEINLHVDLDEAGVDIRHTKADLQQASVTVDIDESAFVDDPDTWTAWLDQLWASDPLQTIGGVVYFETDDPPDVGTPHATASITVPVLRYSEATINALAEYEADLADYQLKIQAIEARASQYARLKQRELIERHGRLDRITKTVFEALMRKICAASIGPGLSYYTEIIARCIDWTRAKLEFESQPLAELTYTDFPPDHFMNSAAVRLFLPLLASAETIFVDTIAQCATTEFQSSVASARTAIDALRADLKGRGNKTIQEFDEDVVIGSHLEAVLSHHEFGR